MQTGVLLEVDKEEGVRRSRRTPTCFRNRDEASATFHVSAAPLSRVRRAVPRPILGFGSLTNGRVDRVVASF